MKSANNCIRCGGVFVIGVLAIVNRAQASGFGKCPNYPSMPKFNLTKVKFHYFYFKFQKFGVLIVGLSANGSSVV